MEQTRFDTLVQPWAEAGTRRRFLGVLAGVSASAAAMLPALDETLDAEAKRKRVRGEHNIRGNKAIMYVNGVTRRVPKKKRKKYLKQGATRGKCTGCTPSCPTDGTCGMADGCGGICGCGAGMVCAEGVCETCNVTCTGSAEACGQVLHDALADGGTLYVCPGRYLRPSGFTMYQSDTPGIYGAGPGTDPASNTILDGTGGTVPVLTVSGGGTAILSGLRVTGGDGTIRPGGIWNPSSILTMENCAIVGNTSQGAAGGGLFSGGPLKLINSLVADNTCNSLGPGGLVIMHDYVGTDSEITNSVIDNNTGGEVAGIRVSLSSATQSMIIDSASQITNNTANGPTIVAGGIANSGAGTVSTIGATVTGNTPPSAWMRTAARSKPGPNLRSPHPLVHAGQGAPCVRLRAWPPPSPRNRVPCITARVDGTGMGLRQIQGRDD